MLSSRNSYSAVYAWKYVQMKRIRYCGTNRINHKRNAKYLQMCDVLIVYAHVPAISIDLMFKKLCLLSLMCPDKWSRPRPLSSFEEWSWIIDFHVNSLICVKADAKTSCSLRLTEPSFCQGK